MEELRWCLRCDGPCRGCGKDSGAKSNSSEVTRALAMLNRANLSPPYNQVVPWLYVGDLRSLFDPPRDVTHIVSLADLPLEQQTSRAHLAVHMEDADTDADSALVALTSVLAEVKTFLHQSSATDGPVVLVHCIEGRSRSVAIATALLMEREHMAFPDAFSAVKKARPRVAPRQCFLDALAVLK